MQAIHQRTLVTAALAAGAMCAAEARADFSITLLHNADAESALTGAPSQPEFGGVARFKTKLDQLRATAGGNVLTLSNGDMFLAGPQLDATLSNPAAPFYDAVAHDLMGYDAHSPANHEFDFGPSVFRRYLDTFGGGDDQFISSNADYSGEPTLAPLIGSKLKRSSVVTVGGQPIGLVGVLPQNLSEISSPGGVTTSPDTRLAIQTEVDLLRNAGVNKIVLFGQQQALNNDLALLPQLRGIDVLISGGGEEILTNPGNPLVPGDSPAPAAAIGGLPNQYPLRQTNGNLLTDADGSPVAVVSLGGKYKYIGQLNLTFDDMGVITAASGNPVRVASTAADPVNGVAPDTTVQSQVVNPINAHIQVLRDTKIARSEVDLEGRRSGPNGTGIRRTETNLGNLVADSLRWQAARAASDGGNPIGGPIVGLQNGGGIRNDSLIAAATTPPPDKNLSRFDAFSINAFANFVVVAEDVPAAKIKQVLEHSVASIGGGQFGQWSGLRFSYDPRLPAGSRIVDVLLENAGSGGGELLIIDEGQVVPGAPAIDLATIDFLANGGDAYPLADLDFSLFSITYTQALENYLTAPAGSVFGGLAGLNGLVSASAYPFTPLDNPLAFDPSRRIDAVPEPAALAAALLGLGMFHRRRVV
jgi:5'-nucleotidase